MASHPYGKDATKLFSGRSDKILSVLEERPVEKRGSRAGAYAADDDVPVRLTRAPAPAASNAATPKAQPATAPIKDELKPVVVDLQADLSDMGLKGISLGLADFYRMDDSEIVSRVRGSSSYMLMNRIQPYEDTSTAAATARKEMQNERIFQYMYNRAHNEDKGSTKIWKELVSKCFADKYAEVRKSKSQKAEIASLSSDSLLAEMRGGKGRAGCVYAAAWLDRVTAYLQSPNAPALLTLKRDAIMAGRGSIEQLAAAVLWSTANSAIQAQCFVDMWGCDNHSRITSGGAPMRYKHQQDLLDQVEQQLTQLERGKSLPPLHIILSTPTGSGKTFSAVMMQLQMLQADEKKRRPGHSKTLLIYSVPTKQILLRVGREYEAHGCVYWAALYNSNLQAYRVWQPYSIRRSKQKRTIEPSAIRDQLEYCYSMGRLHHDRGEGKPDVIVADINAAVALLRASNEVDEDSFYHRKNIVFYFDEPNMGIHLFPIVLSTVKSILKETPQTMILASATLPNWEKLEDWWKVGDDVKRDIITQEPYELPLSRLAVYDTVAGQLIPTHPLELFDSAAEMKTALQNNPRLRVLLLRHFIASQANSLIGIKPPSGDKGAADEVAASSEGVSEKDSTEEVLGLDVRALRESKLQSAFEQVAGNEEQLSQLCSAWRCPVLNANNIRDVFSNQIRSEHHCLQKGVTLIATLKPRQKALELAGKWSDPEGWNEARHMVKGKVRAAETAAKDAAKEARRVARNKEDKDDFLGGVGGGEDAGYVQLRVGVTVPLKDASAEDEDELVLLSRGFAYASVDGVDAVMQQQYQQALLFVPEKTAGKPPPLNVLVVDYSAIYGTDCPAVGTIIMMPDLGNQISWEDHQQFIGRLRRDGTAIYPSFALLRKAVVGLETEAGSPQAKSTFEQRAKDILLRFAQGEATGGDKEARMELLALVSPGRFNKAELAQTLLITSLTSVLTEEGGREKAGAPLLSAALARLRKWGPVSPLTILLSLKLSRAEEQALLVEALGGLCLGRAEGENGGEQNGGANGSQGAQMCKVYLPLAPRLLQEMSTEDLLSEEGLEAWIASQLNANAQDADLLRFTKAVKSVIEWLKEDDEEEEEGEEEEED